MDSMRCKRDMDFRIQEGLGDSSDSGTNWLTCGTRSRLHNLSETFFTFTVGINICWCQVIKKNA